LAETDLQPEAALPEEVFVVAPGCLLAHSAILLLQSASLTAAAGRPS
jgi:hypothetical protein